MSAVVPRQVRPPETRATAQYAGPRTTPAHSVIGDPCRRQVQSDAVGNPALIQISQICTACA
jgi:hypothetical protein